MRALVRKKLACYLDFEHLSFQNSEKYMLLKPPSLWYAGKDWRQEPRGRQRMWWLDGVTNRWTCVWASSWNWLQTAKPPGVLQVHGVAKSQTQLSDFTFTFMHWRRKWQPTPVFLPGESQRRRSLVGCTEPTEPPQSLGSHSVRHDWSDLAAAAAVFIC